MELNTCLWLCRVYRLPTCLLAMEFEDDVVFSEAELVMNYGLAAHSPRAADCLQPGISEFLAWCTKPLNLLRSRHAVTTLTAEGYKRQLNSYLGFCSLFRGFDPPTLRVCGMYPFGTHL